MVPEKKALDVDDELAGRTVAVLMASFDDEHAEVVGRRLTSEPAAALIMRLAPERDTIQAAGLDGKTRAGWPGLTTDLGGQTP